MHKKYNVEAKGEQDWFVVEKDVSWSHARTVLARLNNTGYFARSVVQP